MSAIQTSKEQQRAAVKQTFKVLGGDHRGYGSENATTTNKGNNWWEIVLLCNIKMRENFKLGIK